MFTRIDKFMIAMLGDFDETGRVWARAGFIVLVIGMAMTFDFGRQISWKHGIFLAGLTFVAAFGPEAAYRAFEMRKYAIGLLASVFAATLLTVEFAVDQSYTAGLRGQNRDEAMVQNSKYDGAQEAAKEDKANLTLWESQLAKLMEQNAWAASVKAEALRDQVVSANKEIALETERGGCKSKCALRMKDKADLMARIGTIEQAADLTKRIEATKRKLDEARTAAAHVEYKSSAVVHANNQIAKTVAFFGFGKLKADEGVTEGTDISFNMAMALAATGVPAFVFLIVVSLHAARRDHESLLRAAMPSAVSSVTHNLFFDPFAGKAIGHGARVA